MSQRFLNTYFRVCFLFFLLSLSLLSTRPLSLENRLWVGFFGLVLPFGLGLVLSLQNPAAPAGKTLALPPTLWVWFTLIFLFLRFYRLTSIPFWPLSDESVFTSLALELNRHWNWNLICSGWQMEPMLLWILAGLFKIAAPSILTLRILTVTLSLASTLAAYALGRVFWERPGAFFFAALFSFSFWATGFSRQATPNDLVLLFELVALVLAARYQKTPEKRWFWAAALGLWAGLGFYTFINWTPVWVLLLLLLLTLDMKKEYPKVLFFLFLSLALDVPLILARLSLHASTYLRYRFQDSSWLSSLGGYLKGLFWNGGASFPLGPATGGYFDGLTGALILTGLLALFRSPSKKGLWLALAALALTLLPGILTNDLELQRVTPALPLFLLLAALGAQALAEKMTENVRCLFLTLMLLAVAALNLSQFWGPYDDAQMGLPRRHWRSVDYFNAYRLLAEHDKRGGPFYVFNDWNADYYDKTLDLACYSFNAAQNPNLTASQGMAFLTDVDYEPRLRKRFPHLEVSSLDNAAPADHLLRLFWVPLSDVPPANLKTWLAADRDSHRAAVNLLNADPATPWSYFEEDYAALAVRYGQDPFLASVFWERAASFYLFDRQFAKAAGDFEKALERGYAVPHLRHNEALAVHLSHP